jgi:hypothetical protein
MTMTQSEKPKSQLTKVESTIVNSERHFAYRFFYVGLMLIGSDFRDRGQCWSIPKCLENTDYKNEDIHTVYVYNCD